MQPTESMYELIKFINYSNKSYSNSNSNTANCIHSFFIVHLSERIHDLFLNDCICGQLLWQGPTVQVCKTTAKYLEVIQYVPTYHEDEVPITTTGYQKVLMQLAPECRHRFHLSTFIAAFVVLSLAFLFIYFSTEDGQQHSIITGGWMPLQPIQTDHDCATLVIWPKVFSQLKINARFGFNYTVALSHKVLSHNKYQTESKQTINSLLQHKHLLVIILRKR